MDRPGVTPWREIARDPFFPFLVSMGGVLGLSVPFLPPLFPAFQATFGASYEQLGRTQLIMFLSGLAFSVVGGRISAIFGYRRTIVLVLSVEAAGLVLVAIAPSFAILLGGVALLGFGYMGLLGATGASISVCYTNRRQSIYFIWGILGAVGSMAGPAILGWWVAHAAATGVSWRWGIWVVFAIVAAAAMWGALLRTNVLGADSAGHGGSTGSASEMRDIFRAPVFFIASFWLFFYSLGQMGMMSWIGQIYRERYCIDAARAAYLISVNATGFLVGRIILTWLTARRHLPELFLLAACATGTALSYSASIAAGTYVTGMIAFGFAGFFAAAAMPFAQSYFGLRFPGKTATAFALLNGMGNIGAAVGPYLIGLIGGAFGLEAGIWAMPAFMVSVGVSALGWWARVERPRSRVPEAVSRA